MSRATHMSMRDICYYSTLFLGLQVLMSLYFTFIVLQYTGTPCPRTVTGFCRCFAFRIGKIHYHHCIVRNFQFRKFLPVYSNVHLSNAFRAIFPCCRNFHALCRPPDAKKTACRTFHTAAASFFIFMYIFTLPRASDSFSQEKLRTAHSRRHIQR